MKLPARYRDLVRPEVEEMKGYHVPAAGAVKIRLDANELPYELPLRLKARLAAELQRVSLNRYPEMNPVALKKMILKRYRAPRDTQVVLGNGSDEIIGLLLNTFAGGSRSRPKLLVPQPTFSMFGIIGKSHGWEAVSIETDEEFDLDLRETGRAIVRSPVNLVFLAMPNNPTGNCFDPAVVKWLLEDSGAIVIVDEAYGDFADSSWVDRLGKYPNLVVMKTLSKVGFATARFGMALCNPEIAERLERVRLPYNIGGLNLKVAELAFRNGPEIDRLAGKIVSERERLSGILRRFSGLKVYPSEANFILVRVLGQDATLLWDTLRRKGILVRNLSRPGRLDGCLRITIGTPAENNALVKALEGLLD